MSEIRAAGTLPWRRRRGRLEVALVHRPRYDDWSWAKGKLDPGEEWPVAAVRETLEETGLQVACGLPLPDAGYQITRGGRRHDKVVRYWASEVIGGSGELVNEIDEVAWLDTHAASARLDYPRDRDQLEALVQADEAGLLTTWPLVLVRHAKALPRSSWTEEDPQRPLDTTGHERAQALAPLLAAYGLRRLVTSPSVRCVQTLEPFATSIDAELKLRRGLSEEGYATEPAKALKHLRRALERGRPGAMCSHGPVLPALSEPLVGLVDDTAPGAREARKTLGTVTQEGLHKGEAMVCHMVGTGEDARVVAVERYRPSA